MGQSIDYLQYPECDLIDNYILERLRKGLYTHVMITGLSGTGKSSFGSRLGERLSKVIQNAKPFTEKDIVDSLLELLKRLRQVTQPGEIIMIEEVSVLFPARRSMANENVAIGRILDTCRKKQVILISNAPLFPSIDSHMRSMAQILVETVKINRTQKVVVAKAWKLQTNPHTAKCYRHAFTRNGRDIRLFYSRKPSDELWSNYEKKKDSFLDNLYARLEAVAEKKKQKEDKDAGIDIGHEPGVSLSNREEQVYVHLYLKKRTQIETAKILGLTPARICYINANIKKKMSLGKENVPINIKEPILEPNKLTHLPQDE